MNNMTISIAAIVIVISIIVVVITLIKMNRNYSRFTEEVCSYVDYLIMDKSFGESPLEEETLNSKIEMKLKRLADVTRFSEKKNQQQKDEIQKMVSDISHQLKMPIANITMYNDTILNHDLPRDKEREFLKIMQKQVENLEFLVESLIKMSRLESNLIVLKKEQDNLYECVVEAVSNISLKADKKHIEISLKCDELYILPCDKKWTTEAIFNVLDNAVKYTPQSGTISIVVERLEIFTKLSIIDNGIGIAEEHINDIFKRFYREGKVHKEEGVGIGLYLTREIITKQGGYVKVKSKEGVGTQFSLYLPNEFV